MSFECECVADCGLQLPIKIGMMMLPATWTGSREDGAREGDVFGRCDCVSCVLIWSGYYMFSFSVDVSVCVLICCVYLCALGCGVCLECLFGYVCAFDMCIDMVWLSVCVLVRSKMPCVLMCVLCV